MLFFNNLKWCNKNISKNVNSFRNIERILRSINHPVIGINSQLLEEIHNKLETFIDFKYYIR